MKILKWFEVQYSSGQLGDMVHCARVMAYSEVAAKRMAWNNLLDGNNLWASYKTLKVIRKNTRIVGLFDNTALCR